MKKWVAKVMTHAKAYGWPEQILTPFDEPAKWVQTPGRKSPPYAHNPLVMGTGPWIKPHFEQGCAIIHEAAPVRGCMARFIMPSPVCRS